MKVRVPQLLERLGIDYERRGGELWALCPSHQDAKPSWSICADGGDRHGLHSCFSCGFGGNAVALVIETKGKEFAWHAGDAIDWMKTAGLLAEPATPTRVEVVLHQPMRTHWELPRGATLAPVSKWPTPARRYIESRGIPATQADAWGLGFAVDGRLAGRIVIPIRDAKGRLRSWMARTFTGGALRYLTPTRGEYDTSAVFGEERWPEPGLRRKVIGVAEGALDALAIERSMGWPIAALGGSATQAPDPMKLAKLSTFDRVVVVTDADHAGERAWVTLRGALARHAEVRRVRLSGTDAADLARTDPEALLRALGAA